MRKMVVTGASGLLGANFALEAAKNWKTFGFYHDHPIRLPALECIQANLLHPNELITHLDRIRPDAIVHFAAFTQVDWCEAHPDETRRMNVDVTGHLANWAARNDCKFLFMSTDSVFDGARGGYCESDLTGPLNCYSATKRDAEKVVRIQNGNHLIIRANIYGWNLQAKQSLAEWSLSLAETGRQVPGFTDVIFSPVLVNTLADILLSLLEKEARGTYHIASADHCSKYDFAKKIIETFNLNPKLLQPATTKSAAFLAKRPANTWLKTDKLLEEWGIHPVAIQDDLLIFKQLREAGQSTKLKACAV